MSNTLLPPLLIPIDILSTYIQQPGLSIYLLMEVGPFAHLLFSEVLVLDGHRDPLFFP
jgi:hypothetical protein